MKKNYLCCIRIETEELMILKKQADELKVSLSELCRQKLRSCPQLVRIEMTLKDIEKRLNTK